MGPVLYSFESKASLNSFFPFEAGSKTITL